MQILAVTDPNSQPATELIRGLEKADLGAVLSALATSLGCGTVMVCTRIDGVRAITHLFGSPPEAPPSWPESELDTRFPALGAPPVIIPDLELVALHHCPLRNRFPRGRAFAAVAIATHGALLGHLVVLDDVPQRIFTQADQRSLNEHARIILHAAALALSTAPNAREGQDLEAVSSRFLRLMGHELRTPLNAAIGFTQLARTQLDSARDPRQTALMLQHALSGSERLHELIEQMLLLSAIETGEQPLKLTAVALRSVVREAVDRVRGRAAWRSRPVAAEGPALFLQVDSQALGWIMETLLIEAFGAAPAEGVVGVAWQTLSPVTAAVIVEHSIPDGKEQRALHRPFIESLSNGGSSIHAMPALALRLPVVQSLLTRMQGDLVEEESPAGMRRLVVRLPLANLTVPRGRSGLEPVLKNTERSWR